MQTFTAPITGNYKLEVWGARGGYYGGMGGYSIGYKDLNTSNNLYVCVGSEGSSISGNTGGNGGYNGGGKGGNGCSAEFGGGGGGGGATHIAITSNRGELKNYSNTYESEILLVAGAGGGGSIFSSAGVGGGLIGGNAIYSNNTSTIIGATQTSGYAFGQGQDGKTKTIFDGNGAEGNGGGGGGLYGGLASQYEGYLSDCAGAGGSGYINTTLIANGATIAGDQILSRPNDGNNGYCIITWQQLP